MRNLLTSIENGFVKLVNYVLKFLSVDKSIRCIVKHLNVLISVVLGDRFQRVLGNFPSYSKLLVVFSKIINGKLLGTWEVKVVIAVLDSFFQSQKRILF